MAAVKQPGSEISERLSIWPPYLTAAGVAGWTLWFGGETDVLLGRRDRVQVFSTLEALRRALLARSGEYTPERVHDLEPVALDDLLASAASTVDLDAAATWIAQPGAASTLHDCERALDALNMAIDIGATAGDGRLADIAASEPLYGTLDALTYGLTFIGEGSPFHGDPTAMVGALTPSAIAAAIEVLALAEGLVEVDPR